MDLTPLPFARLDVLDDVVVCLVDRVNDVE